MIFSDLLTFVVVTTAAEDEDLGTGGKKLLPGISPKIISDLTDCNAELSQQRKKRQVSI